MPKPKSDILSGSGNAFEIIKTIVNEVKNRGGSDDDVRRILSDRALQIRIGNLIMGINKPDTVLDPNVYPVEIDYSDTFKQRLDAGRYDQKGHGITKSNFSVKGDGKIWRDLRLVCYNKHMSNDSVLAAIEAQGYRPATIEELLAFGVSYPEVQLEFPILALGSTWYSFSESCYFAPCLCGGDNNKRCLFLFATNRIWDNSWHFLVHK